eukprot:COSAG05_NODE_1114_length_5840_cov_2.676886_3_plen_121_part_00
MDKYIICSFVVLVMQAVLACTGTGFGDDENPLVPFLMRHANTINLISGLIWGIPHLILLVGWFRFRWIQQMMTLDWSQVLRENLLGLKKKGSVGDGKAFAKATTEVSFRGFTHKTSKRLT